jgi:hypothetical protein
MPLIALMEFDRVLKDGGYLYVEVPSNNNVNSQNSHHLSMFGDDHWQYLFRRVGFRLQFRGQFMTFVHLPGTPEGSGWADYYWYYWMSKEGV